MEAVGKVFANFNEWFVKYWWWAVILVSKVKMLKVMVYV